MRCPWLNRVLALVVWSRNLVVRTDVYGSYIEPNRRRPNGTIAITEKGEVTDDVLISHFSGDTVIGLHTINAEGFCRSGLVDYDRHHEEGSQEANEKAAIAHYEEVISLGFSAFLEDSDGRGSYKLWLIFEEPVPARWVRRFLKSLIQDWQSQGLVREPEIFPKQDSLKPGRFGNFVRPPGRHHTLDHWSRIWDGKQWLDGEAAARQILATEGSLGTVIPENFRNDPPVRSASPSSAHPHTVKVSSIPIGMVRSALDILPASFFGTYETWLKLGMSLFQLGDEGLRLWEEASRKCPKHQPGSCQEKWRAFKPDGLTYRSLFHWAKQFGWSPKRWRKSVRPTTLSSLMNAEQSESRIVSTETAPDGLPNANGSVGHADNGLLNGSRSGDNGQAPPGDHYESQPPVGKPRPKIYWEDRPPADVTDEALNAYKKSTYPKRLFVKGGVLTRLRKTEEGPRTEELSREALRGVLFRVADFIVIEARDKQGNPIEKITPPPWFVVDDILHLPEWDPAIFPPLNGIVRCPVIAPDGSLVATPGYHQSSRLYYEPDPSVRIPQIPEHPSEDDIARAKFLFFNELFVDFPFKEESDRANALAYLLTPFVRSLIKGPTPMGIIEAPVQGTGKGLLAFCIGMVAAGEIRTTPMPNTKEEWQKTITALLLTSTQVVLFDNMTGVLYSPDLAAVLTAEVWSARLLTTPDMVTLPIKCTFLGTANNLEAKEDMPRRIVVIRIDAGLEKPDERPAGSFRHKDLLSWVRDNRGQLIWAALVMAKAWLDRGRPNGPQNMGSYESWSRILSGILEVAGQPGFLGNQQARKVSSDGDFSIWKAFCKAWYEKFGVKVVGTKDLFEMVEEGEFLPGVLKADTELGRRQQFGNRLKERTDRVYGQYKIVSAGEDNCGRRLYNLEVIGSGDGNGQVSGQRPDEPPPLPPKLTHDPEDEYPHAWQLPDMELGSRLLYRHCTDRCMYRVYMDSHSAQIFDLAHAIIQCRSEWRLITSLSLVRFAKSRGLLPGILTAAEECVQVVQLEQCFQEANFYLEGLIEIWFFDEVTYSGKKISRYAISDLTVSDVNSSLQSDDQEEIEAQIAPAERSVNFVPFDVGHYIYSTSYETFVTMCRCWWETSFLTLDVPGLFSLVQTFALLPDFSSVFDERTQLGELHLIMEEICGFEFEGFMIDGWKIPIDERDMDDSGDPYFAYQLRLIEGSPLPPRPANAADSWMAKRDQSPHLSTYRDFRRLLGCE